jgi:magnesium transporter
MAFSPPPQSSGKTHVPHYHRSPPGSSPGTLTIHPEALAPKIRVMAYSPEKLVEQEDVSPQEARQWVDQSWPVVWIDVAGLGDARIITQLGELFSLHRLALEDIVNVHQRPKVEPYGSLLFVVARMITLNEQHELNSGQFSIFAGTNFLLTFREGYTDSLGPVRDRIRKESGKVRLSGPDYLMYALLDALLDHYFPVLEHYGERLETLGDDILLRPGSRVLPGIHKTKRELLTLRRAIWPFRDAINSLYRDPHTLITEETRIYLRDCHDHAVRVIDLCENYREMASDLMDIHLSSVSNRMNEVMKVLTIIATIFIPLGFITGLYGMNFDPELSPFNLPETKWKYGYFYALGLMAAVSIGLLVFFRRKGWIGQSRDS